MNNCESVTIQEMMKKIGDSDFEVIESELVCTPTADQHRAVVKKSIVVDGKTYSALGEASIDEDSDITKISVVSVAETRALARALRWATRTSAVAEEEIPAVSGDTSENTSETDVGILPDGTRSPGHWPESQEKWFVDMANEGSYAKEDEAAVKQLLSDIENIRKIKGTDHYDLINRMKKERGRRKNN